MKTFRAFTEATATAGERRNPTRKQRIDFHNKMMDLKHSDAFDKAERRKGIGMWNLTGHNPIGRYGTTKEIEAEKERIFGKRRKGTSDLLWIHFKHGLITHPAIGDVVHSDIDHRFGPWGGDAKNRRMKIDKEIQAKVREGGIGALVGHGRVEHHEGGGGIISYHHAGGMSQGAAVRMIARAYPKYMIHDGFGNLIVEDWSSEGMTPEDRKEENRLFKQIMRVMPSSPRQKELKRRYAALMVKYGRWDAEAVRKYLGEDWSPEYKRSINCNRPKGFSQRAHCQGRKKSG